MTEMWTQSGHAKTVHAAVVQEMSRLLQLIYKDYVRLLFKVSLLFKAKWQGKVTIRGKIVSRLTSTCGSDPLLCAIKHVSDFELVTFTRGRGLMCCARTHPSLALRPCTIILCAPH